MCMLLLFICSYLMYPLVPGGTIMLLKMTLHVRWEQLTMNVCKIG